MRLLAAPSPGRRLRSKRREGADDASGIEVHNNGQIQPSFIGPDVADIDTSFLIWTIAAEILVEHVRRNRTTMIAVGRFAKTPPLRAWRPLSRISRAILWRPA